MLKVENIQKRYGDKLVLDGLSAQFPEGTVTGIAGASGCGKTTLFQILLGLEKPDAGYVLGRPEGPIGCVFQEDRLIEAMTARDNLRILWRRRAIPEADIESALTALGLGAALDQPVRELSGGMKRRVALARGLLTPSPLVLLDEPYKGLDEATRREAMAFTAQRLKGRTALMITHDLREAEALCRRVLTMRDGRLYEE